MGGRVSSTAEMLEVSDLLKLPDGYFIQNGTHTVLVCTQVASDLSKSRINSMLLWKFKRMIFVSAMDWLEGAAISYHDFLF
jgi:hypothetical protein